MLKFVKGFELNKHCNYGPFPFIIIIGIDVCVCVCVQLKCVLADFPESRLKYGTMLHSNPSQLN